MSRIVAVLNGPNLNLLGYASRRSTAARRWPTSKRIAAGSAAELGLDIEFRQSNREYEIIDWIHGCRGRAAGIVINPAAFTHTSVAILDALYAFEGPIIEVHISNVHKREDFRHHSYVSAVASEIIVGCGTQGYALALDADRQADRARFGLIEGLDQYRAISQTQKGIFLTRACARHLTATSGIRATECRHSSDAGRSPSDV